MEQTSTATLAESVPSANRSSSNAGVVSLQDASVSRKIHRPLAYPHIGKSSREGIDAVSRPTQITLVAADLIRELRDLIEEQRRIAVRSPKWFDIDDAVAVYGVPEKTIKLWASQGYVRKSKLGPTFQSKTLYNAFDLNQILCRIAVGKAALVALGRED